MVTLTSILSSPKKDICFTALNMKDAYFYINIHPSHRRFLRSVVGPDHCQYRVLLFDLAIAPRVFTKVLSVVVVYLHLPITSQLASYSLDTSRNLTINITAALSPSLPGNLYKHGKVYSTLTPTQTIDFIGAILDSSWVKAYLPVVIDRLGYAQPSDISLDLPYSLGSHVKRSCTNVHGYSSSIPHHHQSNNQRHLFVVMGGLTWIVNSTGDLDAPGNHGTHKSAGPQSSLRSTQVILSINPISPHSYDVRQYKSGQFMEQVYQ